MKSFTIKCNKCGYQMTLRDGFYLRKKKIKIYEDWYGDCPNWTVIECKKCKNKIEEA